MEKIFRRMATAGLAISVTLPTLANAQDISLASGAADAIFKGTQPNARAGASQDLGDINGDGRRDLIVGSPGGSIVPGAVYVLLGGPDRSGETSLATAEIVITSGVPGNLFGYATAAGNVLNADGTNPKNLAIGAPGANGGRGAVYLYTTGWGIGTAKTEADARLTVLGAPGDQLGSALATGDLDKDGYRELIIGAPGNNRVYMIKGSPTLSGTIDLAATPSAAAVTLTAAGIGRVLIAGDITGDGIYDLLVGSPSQNVVFGYVGAAGALPSGPAISFSGVGGADEAGTSIRLLDIDDDGKTDLVIGAPGGNGPSNGRAKAGSVYVYLGPVPLGAHSLSEAHVVFYGAAAGYRAGDRLTTGDINRDTYNDLVILASGASSGAGELDIYYGVQTYEVTGEGARDIIVGVPSQDSGAGRVFFTISPMLQISRKTEALVARKGASATSSTAIAVTNPSAVITGWQATSPDAWLSASPASGSVVQTSPGAFYIVASTATLPGGVSHGTINVSATTPDLVMTLPVDVTLTVSDARLAIDGPANGATVSNGFAIAGWAIDLGAPTGTGVAAVQAYAYPAAGGAPVFLGTASYGLPRGDVGAYYGSRFTNSGYSLTVNNLTPGATYHLGVFVQSSLTNAIANGASATVMVSAGSPAPGPTPTDPNPTPPPDPSTTPGGPPPPGPGPNTRVAVNRSGLTFGATNNGALHSGAQTVTVSFTSGSATWSASANAPWLNVSPASGNGAGSFKVSLVDGTYRAGETRTATVTITAPGVPNSPLTVPVTLKAFAAGASPIGLIDTPADNSTGVIGAIPVTGWAIDDIGLARITLWRDPLPGEPASSANGKVFLGNAGTVDGARPDIDAAYAMPFNYQAGWGYMLLTNMLPNQGNGTYQLYVFADDVDGHTVQLGTRRLTCDNAHATKPFGSIDTPDQGGSVSGTAYINFGWALAPSPNAIKTDGSTMTVFIDGVAVGHPVYNNARNDIASLFPGRANSSGPVGYYVFNTATLANGVHTIAWGVTDGAGHSEGIGSRFFTVLNGASSSTLSSAMTLGTAALTTAETPVRQSAPAAGVSAGQPVSALDAVPATSQPAYVQKGFETNAPMDIVDIETEGAAPRVKTEELGLVRVTIGPGVSGDADGFEGYLVKGSELAALPAGSFLDRTSGEFFWQPGPGFVGSYDFVFVRTGNGAKSRTSLGVDIAPRRHETEVLVRSRAIKR